MKTHLRKAGAVAAPPVQQPSRLPADSVDTGLPRIDTLIDSLARSMAGSRGRRSVLKAAVFGMAGIACAKLGIGSARAASNCLCNGHVYDSAQACCTAAGIVQKNPIAELRSCPAKVAHAGHVCSPNGCGSEGGYRPPQGFFKANFVPACNAHDCCYDKCNGDKDECDLTFGFALKETCGAAFPGTDPGDVKLLNDCNQMAILFYLAVSKFGQSAFDAVQRQSCDCCGQQGCTTCAGGVCNALPPCVGGGDCVCFSTPEGGGACIHGSTPCAGLQVCASSADCPPGYGCAATSCCGGPPVCGPLCSDISSPVAASRAKGGRTMGGL